MRLRGQVECAIHQPEAGNPEACLEPAEYYQILPEKKTQLFSLV